ncbi:MAG: 2Fe-2S iron-sulfur cluster-binding protein [Candidatus Eiseniibacteriota bacterium]
MNERTITLRVQRQSSPTAPPRWEGFTLPWRPDMSVATCLVELRDGPRSDPGDARPPIEWTECHGRCSAQCAMRINGRARAACTARVDELEEDLVTLQPLAKFVVIRDLIIDREPMIRNIEGLRMGAEDAPAVPGRRGEDAAFDIARCTRCGLCLETCPQVNERSDYLGPAPIVHTLFFSTLPSGRANARQRLAAIMGRGGIADCGNAQNCVEVCPERIPLTEALGTLARHTTALWLARPPRA